MLRARQAQGDHFLRPIFKNCCTQRRLIYVGSDVITPTRREFVELFVGFRSITIDVPLKITKTNVHDHIDALQFGETFEEVKRQRS